MVAPHNNEKNKFLAPPLHTHTHTTKKSINHDLLKITPKRVEFSTGSVNGINRDSHFLLINRGGYRNHLAKSIN